MMTRLVSAVALVLATACCTTIVSAEQFPALRGARDTQLQGLLSDALIKLGLERAVVREKLTLALVDISDLRRPRLAEVNGDKMMYAASLPKIGILLAAMHEVERGNIPYSNGLRRSLTEMIRVSSNVEATRMMNLVGKRRVNEILASPRFRLYDPVANGGIWVGKEYGARPAFERDPMHNISHGATALQVARFYYLLESGQLLRPGLNAVMKETLSHPALAHKFVQGLRGRDVKIYRKSGSWHDWHADSAMVETPRGKYILVALAEDRRAGSWLVSIAGALHEAMYPQQIARR